MLELGKATVRGWWTAGIQDGPDPGTEPDEVPLAGLTITLEPLTRVLTIPADVEGERSKTVILKPFDLTTDENGLMYNPASGGTSPDVSITPSNALSDNPDEYIRWRATINAGDTGVPAIVKTFIALRDEVVDLPTVEQVPDAPVINLTEWMRLVADARAAKDLAVLAAGQAQDFATAAAGSATAADVSATSAAQSATDAGTALTSIPGTVGAEVGLQVPPAVSTEVAAQVPPAVMAELATQGIEIDTTAGTKVTVGGVVVYYDSGWRRVIDYGDYASLPNLRVDMRRENGMVTLSVFQSSPDPAGTFLPYAMPVGFRAKGLSPGVIVNSASGVPVGSASILTDSTGNQLMLVLTANRHAGTVTFFSKDPIPTTLPGTPA